MKGFFDNDIIHKLARCNFLEETITVFGITETYTQGASQYYFKLSTPDKGIAKFGGVDTFNRIFHFIKKSQNITPITNLDFLKLCEEIPNIDAGEALLLDASLRAGNNYFFTGDKRFLRAIVSNVKLLDRLINYQGKIICFEQIILKLIHAMGFGFVREKAIQVLDCDKVLTITFDSQRLRTKQHAIEALNNYIQDLRDNVGDLLFSDEITV